MAECKKCHGNFKENEIDENGYCEKCRTKEKWKKIRRRFEVSGNSRNDLQNDDKTANHGGLGS